VLVIGAKGFAKEVLEILHQNGESAILAFYDDLSLDLGTHLYGQFPILKNKDEVVNYFKNIDIRFTIGIGNPKLRFKLSKEFIDLGGKLTSTISKNSEIGSFKVNIGEGCNILAGVKVSNDVSIGQGTIVYYNSIITHDVVIGKFCELSPDVKLLGRCEIKNFTKIGSGSIIFPDVKIGNNVVIAAGSVVRKDVPDNVMVAGVPAQVKKNI
jgi:sugar O-acyltransferase (sialic acid O-acetyltransferase NeuD family)